MGEKLKKLFNGLTDEEMKKVLNESKKQLKKIGLTKS